MTTETEVKTKLTQREREVYDYYLAGGERGDLFAYVKRGRLGIMKPERSHGRAYAAWLAGRDMGKDEEPPTKIGLLELRRIYRQWSKEEIETIELIEALGRYLGE